MKQSQNADRACKTGFEARSTFHEQLPEVVEDIVENCQDESCFEHIGAQLIPSRESPIESTFRVKLVTSSFFIRTI